MPYILLGLIIAILGFLFVRALMQLPRALIKRTFIWTAGLFAIAALIVSTFFGRLPFIFIVLSPVILWWLIAHHRAPLMIIKAIHSKKEAYVILGLKQKASRADIDEAYNVLWKQAEFDGDQVRLDLLKQAYDYLTGSA